MQKELFFCGERFIYDDVEQTLILEIRNAMAHADVTFGWEGEHSPQAFGINDDALQFALAKHLSIKVLNKGQVYQMAAQVWLAWARSHKSVKKVKSTTIYIVAKSETTNQGYFDGQTTLL